MPSLKQRKKIIFKHSPSSMAARRQLPRKIFPPVSLLLNTWSTSMEPIVVHIKNEYSEHRLEIHEDKQ